jgi:hypothetical protein
LKDWEMGRQVSYKKIALRTQLPHFEGFSNKIQFVCTFSHPNNGYSMKNYIKLNEMKKCCETHSHFLKKYIFGNWVGTQDFHKKIKQNKETKIRKKDQLKQRNKNVFYMLAAP